MKAAPKPEILNPGVKLETRSNINALRTNVNNPSVSKLIGKVSRSRIGLMKTFTRPMIKTATRAVPKLSTSKPGTSLETMMSASALIIHLAIKVNILNHSSIKINSWIVWYIYSLLTVFRLHLLLIIGGISLEEVIPEHSQV